MKDPGEILSDHLKSGFDDIILSQGRFPGINPDALDISELQVTLKLPKFIIHLMQQAEALGGSKVSSLVESALISVLTPEFYDKAVRCWNAREQEQNG